jgi:multiple sugar transport system substrate-binding protein
MKVEYFLINMKKFLNSSRLATIWGLILSICIVFLSGCQGVVNEQKDVIHLTLWQSINPPVNRDVFERLVAKFNQKHKDIQVESIYAEGLPKILTAVVGNAAPDILFFYPQTTGQFVELGAVRPLEDLLDQSPVKLELLPSVFEEMKLDGHIWSIPLYTSNMGIFYRPKLFQAAGITEMPKTWEELRKVAKKLTIDRNGDRRPEQYGMLLPLGKGEWTVFSWFPFLWSAGGEIITDNKPNLTNAGAISALQFWQDLIKDGSATLSPPERGYEEDAFITGRVAMQITGPWTYIMKSKVDFDVFPIPVNLRPATVLGGGNFYVMKSNSEREKAAFKFLEYVLSEEFQKEWSVGTGFIPVNMKAAQSEEFQNFIKQKPVLKIFLEQMGVSYARPIIAGYSRLSDHLGRAIESTLLGKSNAKEALEAAQKRLDIIWGNQ